MTRAASLVLLGLVSCGPTELTIDTGAMEEPEAGASEAAISCAPRMSVFPVGADHNIGYDVSCSSGTCPISCPDAHANSDWGGDHHGVDVFAFHRAPLVAVTAGTITKVGTISGSGVMRVSLRDSCGWVYYYGHLDQAVVTVGQTVQAGQLLGYMGKTGAASTHLHFNVSTGTYSNDINPFNLLKATTGTACATPPPPPAPSPVGCGALEAGAGLTSGQSLSSCDGRFTLAMQSDGNLVLYFGGAPLWHTYTNGRGGYSLQMQGDGNLVLYTAAGTPLWHTHTNERFGARLALQDDGNLVLYQGGTVLWHSQTCCH